MNALVSHLVILGRCLGKYPLERWIIWRLWSWAHRFAYNCLQFHTSHGHQHGGNLICISLWRQLKTKNWLWSNISIEMALFSRPFLVQTVTVSDSTTWSRDDAFEETSNNFSLHLRPFRPIPVEEDASSKYANLLSFSQLCFIIQFKIFYSEEFKRCMPNRRLFQAIS